MAYKQRGNPFNKIKDTPIYRKNLEDGVLGKANDDGTIDIDKSVKPGSPMLIPRIRVYTIYKFMTCKSIQTI